MKEKTAYILVGGGMRSAHGAGFLYALGTRLRLPDPDIIIGTSGNAGNTLYYIAGQYDALERVWTRRLSTPRFISGWRFWKILNINYLIDEVIKKQEPLNIVALGRSRVRWLIPITDADTGTSTYVSGGDGYDFFELLRAAKALPFFFGERVAYDHHRYIDGGLAPSLRDHVARAKSEGATSIVIVNDAGHAGLIHHLIKFIYTLTQPPKLRRALLHGEHSDPKHAISEGVRIFHIRTDALPLSSITRNQHKLTEAFENGIRDALENEAELRTLLA